MLTKIKTAIVAAMLLGSVSGSALANNSPFDVNIYVPVLQDHALGVYVQEPTKIEDQAVKPLPIDEKLWMDRASQRS
jgi:hypothetical protein